MREGAIFKMSLINQALKKTQSLLHEQKKRSIHSSELASESVMQTTSTPPFARLKNPFYQKSTTLKSFEALSINKYWAIGIASAIFITCIGFEIVTHFTVIEKRYANFYEKLFSSTTVKKKPVPIIAAPVVVNTAAPIASLTLEGTMETGHKRAAMINGDLYSIGEIIAGYKIMQIHYDHIVLQNIVTHHIHTLSPKLIR